MEMNMERKIYRPTEKQEQKWAEFSAPQMPTDDEFKTEWKKAHHGKEAGWGMMKRNWILRSMSSSREYQMGLWQGRVDKIRGLDYQEKQDESTYNLGYYRGYTNCESDLNGMNSDQKKTFLDEYKN